MGDIFFPLISKYLGSDNLPGYIAGMVEHIRSRGVTVTTGEEALDILVENGRAAGVVTTRGEYRADRVILAPGRVGAEWIGQLARRHGLAVTQRGIEVGVRVEVHNEIMQDLCSIIYDLTFFIRTGKYNDRPQAQVLQPGDRLRGARARASQRVLRRRSAR